MYLATILTVFAMLASGGVGYMYRDVTVPTSTKISAQTVSPSIAPSPTPSPDEIAKDVYNLVNEYRKNNGLSYLTKSVPTCAIAGARLPEAEVDWSHDGFWKYSRLYSGISKVGENLARNYFTSKEVLDAWIKSPEHKENLDKPEWKYMCIKSENYHFVQIFSD